MPTGSPPPPLPVLVPAGTQKGLPISKSTPPHDGPSPLRTLLLAALFQNPLFVFDSFLFLLWHLPPFFLCEMGVIISAPTLPKANQSRLHLNSIEFPPPVNPP